MLQFKPKTPHPKHNGCRRSFIPCRSHSCTRALASSQLAILPAHLLYQLPHRKGKLHKNSHSPLSFTPGDTPTSHKFGFAFHLQDSCEENTASWNSDEGWIRMTEEDCGYKYLARSNLLWYLHTPETHLRWYRLFICRLKFTRARSALTDTSYSKSHSANSNGAAQIWTQSNT